MITTIIFDLSEVYLGGLRGAEEQLLPLLGLDYTTINQMLRGENFYDLMNGKISEEDYLNNIIEQNNLSIKPKDFRTAIRKNFFEVEGTREIIEQLKAKGYRLGLLSVHAREWVDFLNAKYDYHKLFDSISYSFEVAVCKPDKDAYRFILEKLNAKPGECIFIDDSPRNIEAAKELGINSILFSNPQQLKQELAGYSIDID